MNTPNTPPYVYVVSGCVDYENSAPILVFTDRDEAERFVAACRRHDKNIPKPRDYEKEINDPHYIYARHNWVGNHPAGSSNALWEDYDIADTPLVANDAVTLHTHEWENTSYVKDFGIMKEWQSQMCKCGASRKKPGSEVDIPDEP